MWGEHVVVAADGVDYRIACAGSGRWTVTARSDGSSIAATLELSAGLYNYALTGDRGVSGEDWSELLLAGQR